MKLLVTKSKINEKGMALVFTLIILALMISSALALARILLGEVKMSLNITNSIVAFHSADSGIEKALYYIKYARDNSDLTPFEALASKSYAVNSNQSFKVIQASSTSPGFIAYNVTNTKPAYVDIMDPTGNVSVIDWGTSGVTNYQFSVDWSIQDCATHASDKMEITIDSFQSGFSSPATDKKIVICGCAIGSDSCNSDLSSFSTINPNTFYRFSFRPLDKDTVIKKLDFNVTDDSGIIGILSETEVVVDGSYKNSTYRVKVAMPALGKTSNVFSYVIFSEEDLIKSP